jgi:hypothetical protein
MIIGIGAWGVNELLFTTSGVGGGQVNLSHDIYPDVADWMNQCDAKGEGVFLLELSPEKAHEFLEFRIPNFFDTQSEWDTDTLYLICIYINIQKGEGFSDNGSRIGDNDIAFIFTTIDEAYESESKTHENLLSYHYTFGRSSRI